MSKSEKLKTKFIKTESEKKRKKLLKANGKDRGNV